MTEVIEDRKAQLYAESWISAFCWKISPPSVEAKAQIRMATQAAGTMMDLAMKSQRSWLGCMIKNGICASQKRKKEIIVAVSIPWDSGMWLGRVRKEGQIAPIITRTVLAPFMVWIANQKMARIAREMMAM